MIRQRELNKNTMDLGVVVQGLDLGEQLELSDGRRQVEKLKVHAGLYNTIRSSMRKISRHKTDDVVVCEPTFFFDLHIVRKSFWAWEKQESGRDYLLGSLLLHADVHARVLACSNLDDGQLWVEGGVRLAHLIDLRLDVVAKVPIPGRKRARRVS